MKSADRERFMRCLLACAELYGKDVGGGAASLWWSALQSLPIEEVEAGFAAFVKDTTVGRFMPKPADILAHAQAQDGRPGAEEAWALIPKDESTGQVVTDEMMQAYGVCCALLDEGDPIAAHMAFREAYTKAIAAARSNNVPVRWFLSAGRDSSTNVGALETAVTKGRITATYAAKLLPNLATSSPQIAALLSGVAANLTTKALEKAARAPD